MPDSQWQSVLAVLSNGNQYIKQTSPESLSLDLFAATVLALCNILNNHLIVRIQASIHSDIRMRKVTRTQVLERSARWNWPAFQKYGICFVFVFLAWDERTKVFKGPRGPKKVQKDLPSLPKSP